MHTPDRSQSIEPIYTPTPRGRLRAFLASVEARWDSLSPAQQEQCLELIAALSAAARRQEVAAVREAAS